MRVAKLEKQRSEYTLSQLRDFLKNDPKEIMRTDNVKEKFYFDGTFDDMLKQRFYNNIARIKVKNSDGSSGFITLGDDVIFDHDWRELFNKIEKKFRIKLYDKIKSKSVKGILYVVKKDVQKDIKNRKKITIRDTDEPNDRLVYIINWG